MKEMEKEKKESWFENLRSPWAILIGVILGFAFGVLFPNNGKDFQLVGDLFLSYMTMCTLPIIVSAVISSLGGAFRSKKASKRLLSMFKNILLFNLMIAALTAGVFSYYEMGYKIDKEKQKTLGNLVKVHSSDNEVSLANKNVLSLDFLKKLIPENIFAALSKGDIVGIIFFSIFLGIALGVLRCESSQKLLEDFDAIFRACQVMLEWGLYFLPIGICSIIASQFSSLGGETFRAILELCFYLYMVSCFVILIFWYLISKVSGKSMKEVFVALKKPLLIGVSTQDSLLAIPSLIVAFQNSFNQDNDDSLQSTIPLTVLFCKTGTIIYMIAVTSFFIVFLDHPVENIVVSSIFLILGPVFLSFGDSGGGTAIYSMLTVILNYFGLPIAVAIPLLVSFDFLFDPVLIAVDLLAASTIALFQTRKFAIIDQKN